MFKISVVAELEGGKPSAQIAREHPSLAELDLLSNNLCDYNTSSDVVDCTRSF